MAMQRLRVGYLCLARRSFDIDYAEALFEESLAALQAMDVDLVHVSGLSIDEDECKAHAEHLLAERVDVAIVQYATFSLGALMPGIAQRLPMPLILWGVPEPTLGGGKLRSNSLCAINMNAHTLMRLGREYEYVFCHPKDVAAQLKDILSVMYCLKRLRNTRLGLVGYRVPGFYTSTFDELGLRRLTGVEVHHVTLAEVLEETRQVDEAACAKEGEAIRSEACRIEVPDHEIDKAAALYLAFRKIVEQYELDALAVKCWPEFPSLYSIAACSTIGRLNHHGIVTSCEGDTLGAVTMLMERYLTGESPIFMDFVHIDEEDNTGIAWHCGAAPVCLSADPSQVELCLHTTVEGGGKKGIAAEFAIRGGSPATLARLSAGRNDLRLFFAGGEAVDKGKELRGNPLSIRFDSPVRHVVDVIMKEGLEHHYAVVHADVRPQLRLLAKWLGIECIDVDARQQSIGSEQ